MTISSTRPERLGSLPKELVLDLDITEPVGPLFKGKAQEGNQYPQTISDWFSLAINLKVIAIHTPAHRKIDLNPQRVVLKQ